MGHKLKNVPMKMSTCSAFILTALNKKTGIFPLTKTRFVSIYFLQLNVKCYPDVLAGTGPRSHGVIVRPDVL